ncbi:eCIS core domain-containing protein [Collimonas silvisoli]|uniref:eCIS core domain-containing protein n=1 Tax=Collimonas silvisoli TaxID=2825884 RepID=UPI001B8C9925|nr:DUF4157 domain-containing protein [Collimonas silvisoli]
MATEPPLPNPRSCHLTDHAASAGGAPEVVQQRSGHHVTAMAAYRYAPSPLASPIQRSAADGNNRTGLPDGLKAGIEGLSGLSMDQVKVHYNSAEPARLQALAYAQGADIHLAPGQERHLPHEAWHVVQQRQGRVQPTLAAQGVAINDDRGLEREADVMGGKAAQLAPAAADVIGYRDRTAVQMQPVVQRVMIGSKDIKADKAGNNEKIFSDALDALIEAQEGNLLDPDSWISKVNAINLQLQAHGMTPTVKAEIEDFYEQVAELNFKVNPVLEEAWRRCLNASSNKTNYTSVGGKFKDKMEGLLHEIAVDFPSLAAKTKKVPTFKVNKEHMVNKGKKFGGAQTAYENLMFAAAPPTGAKETLSALHKELHAMKPGTGYINYNAMDTDIQDIIEDAQTSYSSTAMGTFK